MSYSEARAVKNELQDELLSIPGVVGVGVRNPSLVIYVDSEATAKKISLSKTAQDVPVMIRVTGQVKALAMVAEPVRVFGASAQDPSMKYRPAPAGASIGHYAITAGTFGCLALAGGQPVILSNNHVLANASSIQNPNAKIGDAILQPGKYDGGTMADSIGTLGKYVSIDEAGSNVVDCAYAIPSNQSVVSDGMLNYEGILSGVAVGKYGMEVYKSGRTTGLTQSTIIDLDASIKVAYTNFEALFTNQIVIDSPNQSFGAGGDSGSIVFTIEGDQLKAVALLFAGSDTIILANKIQDVMGRLGVNVPYTGGGGALPSSSSLGALVGLGALAFGGYLVYKAVAPKGRRRIF